MKINPIQPSVVNPYKANQMKADQVEQKARVNADKLEISTEAKQLSETSPFAIERNERVQQLKAQVQSGTYEVNPDELASNLVNYFKR